jgi:hypothetical protein
MCPNMKLTLNFYQVLRLIIVDESLSLLRFLSGGDEAKGSREMVMLKQVETLSVWYNEWMTLNEVTD